MLNSQTLFWIASGLIGSAVAVLVLVVRTALDRSAESSVDPDRYDVARLADLREASLIVRVFEPLVHLLGGVARRLLPEELPAVQRDLHVSGASRAWKPEEWLASTVIAASLFSLPGGLWCLREFGLPGLVMAAVFVLVVAVVMRRRLHTQAVRRMWRIKTRLPYFLDLVNLLMEAGATFLNALREAVREFADQPVGQEFGRVLTELSLGRNRSAALESMRDRLQDDEITSLVGAIIQGEEHGSPLAQVLRGQADFLRIKRTQRAETIAGEAGVQMLFPAMLVMMATVILILAPFAMEFVSGSFFDR
ncbi:MAG: type II secretion system F family protein [Planctomycetota bacterium]|jgi:tight adherence protein C|nr:MAG: type II secretion system F family protein [Planctomycetota bacterium]